MFIGEPHVSRERLSTKLRTKQGGIYAAVSLYYTHYVFLHHEVLGERL